MQSRVNRHPTRGAGRPPQVLGMCWSLFALFSVMTRSLNILRRVISIFGPPLNLICDGRPLNQKKGVSPAWSDGGGAGNPLLQSKKVHFFHNTCWASKEGFV